jgi:hypothetical protein
MRIGKKPVLMVVLFLFSLSICAQAGVTVDFLAGTPAGWDLQTLPGDVARNNTVDWNDLSVIAQYWLNGSCGSGNNWCGKADIDKNAGVDLEDYALLSKSWGKQAGSKVLLQTIYGTGQDSAGNITANSVRNMQINKGQAMAFAVPQNTLLDKAIIKCSAIGVPGKSAYNNNIRIRLFNVTGKGYLTSGHTMTKADPGSGASSIFDVYYCAPVWVMPSHTEGTATTKYTDMAINFDSLPVTAGEYLITFDPLDVDGESNTWGNLVRGTGTEPANMGLYPDGVALPKRATVTAGNTYWYQLDATSNTNYTGYSNLYNLCLK